MTHPPPPADLIDLIEHLAQTAYMAGRPPGSGRPEWNRCTDEWRAAMIREMEAAIRAGVEAGMIEIKTRRTA